MIAANELRIGNLVETVIDKDSIGYIYGYTQVDSLIANFEVDANPIPLTHEILIKCGFDEWSTENYRLRKSLTKNGWSSKFNYYLPYFYLSTYTGSVTIKYLHQLQNLYFALTGEELNIQL